MTKDTIVAARLDLVAAKAKIIAEQYRNNQMWEGDLDRGISEIEQELSAIRRGSGGSWASTDGGRWQR